MHIAIQLLYYCCLLLVLCVGIVLTVQNSPGPWVIVLATAAYAYVTRADHYVGFWTLAVLAGLGLFGELVDRSIGKRESRRRGAGKWAPLGATIGGLLGGFFLTFLIPIPPFGTIAGICAGCFIGAILVELLSGKEARHALGVGTGAAKARFLAILFKSGLALIMFFISVIVAFPTHWRTASPGAAETPGHVKKHAR